MEISVLFGSQRHIITTLQSTLHCYHKQSSGKTYPASPREREVHQYQARGQKGKETYLTFL